MILESNVNIVESILYLYPNAKFGTDFYAIYDGTSFKLIEWRMETPPPSLQELEKAYNDSKFNVLKQNKINELDNACKNAILNNFTATLNGVDYEFAYDDKAQIRFTGVGVLFLGNKITNIDWTAYLNCQRMRITLSKDDFDSVSLAALKHQDDNIKKYSDLYVQVMSATTADEVNQIVW
ncbi:MAG: XkdW family protein [Bacteroidota bacterium]|nr:XkdW family protein [Bacteroidota bacterium]